MRRYRAVVGVLLAAIATFLVSCGGGPAAAPPTYTPEKVAQISNYVGRLDAKRQRLPELLNYIEKDNWVNVDNFTHGPLGQLRAELLRLSNQLLPEDQPKAKALSEEILDHLEDLDKASQNRSYGDAITQFRAFSDDLNVLFDLLPEGAIPEPEPNVLDVIEETVESDAYNFDSGIDETREPEIDLRDSVEDASDSISDSGSELID